MWLAGLIDIEFNANGGDGVTTLLPNEPLMLLVSRWFLRMHGSQPSVLLEPDPEHPYIPALVAAR